MLYACNRAARAIIQKCTLVTFVMSFLLLLRLLRFSCAASVPLAFACSSLTETLPVGLLLSCRSASADPPLLIRIMAFCSEISLLKELNHPTIVKLHEVRASTRLHRQLVGSSRCCRCLADFELLLVCAHSSYEHNYANKSIMFR